MIRVKDLKERFSFCNQTITIKGAYNIYDAERDGQRTQKLYLGYVTLNRGKATHVPSGLTTADIDELLNIARNWADNTEYEVSTYNPDMLPEYVAEIRLHDYLLSIGFENVKYSGLSHVDKYTMSVSDMFKAHSRVINVEVNREYKSNVITCLVSVDANSYMDFSDTKYENIIGCINSLVKVTMLNVMTTALTKFNKLKDADLNLLNDMTIKTLNTSTFETSESSFKDYVITSLENTLNTLKNN